MKPDYYPDYNQKRRTVVKVGVITAVIITLVIICYVVFAFFFRMGKVKVEVVYAPHYAEVELNGKKVKNPSTRYLEPGEYEVRVWAAEFEEFSTKVQVDENTKYIYGSLNPATAKGEELMNGDLQQQFLEIEGIAGQVFAEEGEKINAEYPILQKLPYKNSLYTLGYLINSGERDYTLTVKVLIPSIYDSAVEKLKTFAEETNKPLAEYRIDLLISEDFSDPFKDVWQDNNEKNPELFLKKGYSAIPNLIIRPGQEKDGYYYTILSVNATEYTVGTTYRVVLKANGDSWKLVGVPTPIATIYNTPDVPLDILNSLNGMNPPTPTITPGAYGI